MDLFLQVQNFKVWRPGSRKILGLTHLPLSFRVEVLKHFAVYMADVYRDEVKAAIEDQRLAERWPALSEKYVEKKKEMGWSLKMWQRTGLLQKSIKAWKNDIPEGYVVGIKQDVWYSENGKKIRVRDVARWMEYGTGERAEDGLGKRGWPGMPPRPLFRPIQVRLRKSITTHWRRFLDEYGDAVDELLALATLSEASGEPLL